jgi:sulfate transport system permease protein
MRRWLIRILLGVYGAEALSGLALLGVALRARFRRRYPSRGATPHGKRVLPGFRVALGWTVFYLLLIVLIPVSALFLKAASLSWRQFWSAVTSARALAAYRLSFGVSLAAALIDGVIGLLLAWVLVRYRFPVRRLLDGLVDLPLALPTAVSGIVLTTLYAPHGWIGRRLQPLGIKVAYTPLGIVVALIFIGLPFAVRTIQPVLQDLDPEIEDAALSLGANLWQRFYFVILPELLPAWLTGVTLAFARGLGEYGSVVFIAGNMPMRTEITPLLIMTRLDQYDYAGASALAAVFLVVSLGLLLGMNAMQQRKSVLPILM